MKILGGIYTIMTWGLILTFTALGILYGLYGLKHIVPNEGDEALIDILKKALNAAKWLAFLVFLAFVILSFLTAGTEYIAYGGFVNPTLCRISHAIGWIADIMSAISNKVLGGYRYSGF